MGSGRRTEGVGEELTTGGLGGSSGRNSGGWRLRRSKLEGKASRPFANVRIGGWKSGCVATSGGYKNAGGQTRSRVCPGGGVG